MQVAVAAAPPNHETLHSQKTEEYTIILTDTENRLWPTFTNARSACILIKNVI